jgi:hypothetical protein
MHKSCNLSMSFKLGARTFILKEEALHFAAALRRINARATIVENTKGYFNLKNSSNTERVSALSAIKQSQS